MVESKSGADRVTGDQAGEDLAERISALEERARAAETRAAVAEDIAAQFFALAGAAQRIRAGPCRTVPDAGPLESFTVVVDALAAELGVPRAEIVRRMMGDIEVRIALDRAVLTPLRRLEETGPSGDQRHSQFRGESLSSVGADSSEKQ